ncbi:hypothetical protein RM844_31960 [Streptomyces sp. DSM 44915]|uniref:Uncharacterized protein n=1 Tax=Streptomyces chisholmiae TaxID=3075540 RepID=A0ABU2K1K8_9ACTN|nr:hypothetical protein [Streptomyces sp. DSM 44915]MDT0270894.1 hypothetical protein [Streptomyces sp. DSM 44915]
MLMSEKEFVARAMSVAGVSESFAREAYDNPEIGETIPVEIVSEDEAEVIEVGELGTEAVNGTRVLTSRRDYNNAFGNRLFRYTVEKYWAGTGRGSAALRSPPTTAPPRSGVSAAGVSSEPLTSPARTAGGTETRTGATTAYASVNGPLSRAKSTT